MSINFNLIEQSISMISAHIVKDFVSNVMKEQAKPAFEVLNDSEKSQTIRAYKTIVDVTEVKKIYHVDMGSHLEPKPSKWNALKTLSRFEHSIEKELDNLNLEKIVDVLVKFDLNYSSKFTIILKKKV